MKKKKRVKAGSIALYVLAVSCCVMELICSIVLMRMYLSITDIRA